MIVNLIDAQKGVLPRLELKKGWLLDLENDHSRSIGARHRGSCCDFGMVFVIQMHGGTITKVKEQSRSEPLEGLASCLSFACFHIQSVSNGHKVHDEYSVVDGIEDLVWNGIPKVGGESHQQQECQDAVSGNHDFFGELVAKGLFSIRAKQSKEGKEENDRPKDDDDHGIPEVNVHAKASVQGQDVVDERITQAADRIA